MTLSHKFSSRVEQWSLDFCGTKPITVPVHHLAPANRVYFNARDFCKQHSAVPVYGWVVDQRGPILKAQYYVLVRYHNNLFSITKTDLGTAHVIFFEDKKNHPRIFETTYGCDLMHSFHPLIYPETSPAKKIEIVNPDDAIELQMEIPPLEKQKTVSKSKSYPPVEATEPVVVAAPVIERQKDNVVHPFLRNLKKYTLGAV